MRLDMGGRSIGRMGREPWGLSKQKIDCAFDLEVLVEMMPVVVVVEEEEETRERERDSKGKTRLDVI